MLLTCVKCGGTAEPAARTGCVKFGEQRFRFLVLVSTCGVCGHCWDEEEYGAENQRREEQARAADARRQAMSPDEADPGAKEQARAADARRLSMSPDEVELAAA